MRVEVLYFAIVRERLGRERESRELPPGASVGQLWASICAQHPELEPMRGAVSFAVNREYAEPGHELRDGDEVAVIPPVSGGSTTRSAAPRR